MHPESATAFPEVTIILVTYNSRSILEANGRFLAGLVRVILVDNASTDGTADFVATAFPAFELIRCPENLGFGRANNLGLERTQSPFALVLNPDCAFSPEAMTALLAAAQRYPEAAILSPRLFDASGRPQENAYNVEFFDQLPGPFREPEGDLCTWLVPGAAMCLRMSAMRTVGFFDPDIFMYFEDDDICMRARRAGFTVMLIATARMQHLVGSSSRRTLGLLYRKYFHETRSRIYFFRKYRSATESRAIARKVFLKNLSKLPLFMLSFNSHMVVRSWARIRAALGSLQRG